MQAHLNEETSLNYLCFTPAAVYFLEIALEIDGYCLCSNDDKRNNWRFQEVKKWFKPIHLFYTMREK